MFLNCYSHFGVFNENEEVVLMQNTRFYKNDTFGLRTLDKMSKVITITLDGVGHLNWHRNLTVVDDYIIPYLD